MPTVRYTVAQGEVIAEKREGVRSLYVPDPLGSTLALIDNTQTITDTWVYWPYGEVKTRTGTTATPLQYVGTQGYYHDSDGRAYARGNVLDKAKARWLTETTIRLASVGESMYCYSLNNPVTHFGSLVTVGDGDCAGKFPGSKPCRKGKKSECDKICREKESDPGRIRDKPTRSILCCCNSTGDIVGVTCFYGGGFEIEPPKKSPPPPSKDPKPDPVPVPNPDPPKKDPKPDPWDSVCY